MHKINEGQKGSFMIDFTVISGGGKDFLKTALKL